MKKILKGFTLGILITALTPLTCSAGEKKTGQQPILADSAQYQVSNALIDDFEGVVKQLAFKDGVQVLIATEHHWFQSIETVGFRGTADQLRKFKQEVDSIHVVSDDPDAAAGR